MLYCIILSCVIWFGIISYHIACMSCHMVWYDILYCIILYSAMSYWAVSHCVVFYYIVLCHVVLYHIVSYSIVWCNIVLHCVLLHHVVQYHIILWQIILYCMVYTCIKCYVTLVLHQLLNPPAAWPASPLAAPPTSFPSWAVVGSRESGFALLQHRPAPSAGGRLQVQCGGWTVTRSSTGRCNWMGIRIRNEGFSLGCKPPVTSPECTCRVGQHINVWQGWKRGGTKTVSAWEKERRAAKT